MRTIDADKLKEHYSWWDNEYKSVFDQIIDIQPTVSMEKTGRWIDEKEWYYAHCSECGYQMAVHENRGYHRYCPNCGAKMGE